MSIWHKKQGMDKKTRKWFESQRRDYKHKMNLKRVRDSIGHASKITCANQVELALRDNAVKRLQMLESMVKNPIKELL